MKFIAPSDFSQGLGNPLKIPSGEPFVKKGTIFSIGDDLPVAMFSDEDLKLHFKLFTAGRICRLESEWGSQILADMGGLEVSDRKAAKTKEKPSGVLTTNQPLSAVK